MPSFVGPGTTATIASGQTTSNAIVMDPAMSIVSLILPAAMTGTSLTFTGSVDGVTYNQITNSTDGTAFTVAAIAGGKAPSISATTLSGYPFIKIVSQAAEAATRVITPMVRIV